MQEVSKAGGDILRACSFSLTCIEKEFLLAGLGVDFWNGEPSLQFNEIFISDGVLHNLEGNDYQCIDILFLPI